MYKLFIKRMFGFISSVLLFLIISPLFVLLAILVRIKLGRPIFFKQKRTTKNNKEFEILKFRTMTEERDVNGKYLPDEERLTKFGRFLRSSSLDELPELLNIIKGDMAVIGPRPLPTSYTRYFKKEEMARFKVRGGLIPPDSIDPSTVISWDKQFKYESDYGNSVCLLLDIKIMINAIRIIFQRNKTDYGSFVRNPLNVERNKKLNDIY